VLTEYPCDVNPAGNALCAIANAEADLSMYLLEWMRTYTPSASAHLADFVSDAVPRWMKKGKLPDAFWGERAEQAAQVVDLLKSERLTDHVGKLFFRFEQSEPELAAALSDAEGLLAGLRG
jgi:hypothetical protein